MAHTQEAFLAALGWTVECESPFEIRHEDGSFASGQAASMTLLVLQQDAQAEADHAAGQAASKTVTELNRLIGDVLALRDAAAKENSSDAWRTCYNLVFSDRYSGRIGQLRDELNLSLDYADPDMDYDDDVLAYASALADLRQRIAPFLAVLQAP